MSVIAPESLEGNLRLSLELDHDVTRSAFMQS